MIKLQKHHMKRVLYFIVIPLLISSLINSKSSFDFCLSIFSFVSIFFISSFIGIIFFIYKKNDALREENIIITRELEKLKAEGANLQHIAKHDFLTGIPNKRAFIAKIKEDFRYAKRYKAKLALLTIDIDNFKKVNDDHGHNFGDFIIQKIADRLKENIRNTDFVARTGGDEFIVMFHSKKMTPDIIAKKLLYALKQPYIVGGKEIDFLSASIGVAFFPKHALDYKALMEISDNFMYKAKKKQNCYYCE